MARLHIVAGLLLAATLAGCLEGDAKSGTDEADGDGTRSPSRTRTSGPGSVSASASAGPVSGNASAGAGGNATGNGTAGEGNATGNSTGNATWTYDNRTGSISGTGLLINGPFSEEEAFNVTNGTSADGRNTTVERLVLNLTSDGRDVTLSVRGPGCEEDECATEAVTEDGKAELAFDKPAAGNWTATLSISGIGPVSADYELSVQHLVNATASP